jgi:hypothetical protein
MKKRKSVREESIVMINDPCRFSGAPIRSARVKEPSSATHHFEFGLVHFAVGESDGFKGSNSIAAFFISGYQEFHDRTSSMEEVLYLYTWVLIVRFGSFDGSYLVL